MVLDEPKETDDVFNINGFTLVIDKNLHGQTRDITVDFVSYGMGSGFKLTSEVPVAGAGGGCSSAGSCKC